MNLKQSMLLLTLALSLASCGLFQGPDVGPARVGLTTARTKGVEMEQIHVAALDAFQTAVDASSMTPEQKATYTAQILLSRTAMFSSQDDLDALLDSLDGFLKEVGETNMEDLEAAAKSLYDLYKKVRRGEQPEA